MILREWLFARLLVGSIILICSLLLSSTISVVAQNAEIEDAENTKQSSTSTIHPLTQLINQLDSYRVPRPWKQTQDMMLPSHVQRGTTNDAVGQALHLHLDLDRRQRHAFFLGHHRLAHAFEDSECSQDHEDFHRRSSSDQSSSSYVNTFIGMKLHVFQQILPAAAQQTQAQTTNNNLEHEPKNNLLAAAAKQPDISELRSESFVFEQAYQLLEPLHLELGIVPRHYLDYAYRPVIIQEGLGGGGGGGALVNEDPSTTNHDETEEEINNNKAEENKKSEEDSCMALIPEDEERRETCKAVAPEVEHATFSSSWWKWWFPFANQFWKTGSTQSDYNTAKSAFAGGSHGEVWRGRRTCLDNSDTSEHDCNNEKPLILKRLKVERGYRLLEAGLREVYFGNWIRQQQEDGQALYTTYVDHFFRDIPRAFGRYHQKDMELWIVFEDAGPSIRNYLYAPVSTSGGFIMYQHSPLWTQLRTESRDDIHRDEEDTSIEVSTYGDDGDPPSEDSNENKQKHTKHGIPNLGREIMRSVLHQILSAAALLHEHGIVHRDIKPSNVMCTSDIELDDMYTTTLEKLPNIHCRLGDFSSGWDQYTSENLYTKGPSPAEQTDEYAPPESYIGPNWVPFHEHKPQSYDSWSIGVLALELLLGTPNVFSVDQRTTVLLTNKMKKEGASDEELQRALYLAALSQFCIYVPTNNSTKQQSWPLRNGDPLYKTAMVKESCTLQDFHRALRARDPLGVGFDSSTDFLLDLILQLLAWDPMERITATKALQHPFFLSPGHHNALESQLLDPRLDFDLQDNVEEFVCPKCGRVFSDWRSCHRHANTRRHAKFCTYDRSSLPTCINTHSMLPAHPTSGYCDLQGRRRTIEDFHSIHLHPTVQFYGMFDGHMGNAASKFAASTLYEQLVMRLPTLKEASRSTSTWKVEVQHNISESFREIHERFLVEVVSLAPNMEQSGTTATAVLVTDEVIVVSSLGDSRAVLSSTDSDGIMSAIPLTPDHVASDPTERELVIGRGGSVSSSGGIDRVNGTLAITRSIGDANLASLLSRDPHVVSMTIDEIRGQCGERRGSLPCFIVLASDGLWDVISNQEAVDMVVKVMESYASTDRVSWNNGGAFQEAAEVLAIDAYVRGSTDNIGVCVVAVD
jgi:serine/threonine protein phosphatase PrpC